MKLDKALSIKALTAAKISDFDLNYYQQLINDNKVKYYPSIAKGTKLGCVKKFFDPTRRTAGCYRLFFLETTNRRIILNYFSVGPHDHSWACHYTKLSPVIEVIQEELSALTAIPDPLDNDAPSETEAEKTVPTDSPIEDDDIDLTTLSKNKVFKIIQRFIHHLSQDKPIASTLEALLKTIFSTPSIRFYLQKNCSALTLYIRMGTSKIYDYRLNNDIKLQTLAHKMREYLLGKIPQKTLSCFIARSWSLAPETFFFNLENNFADIPLSAEDINLIYEQLVDALDNGTIEHRYLVDYLYQLESANQLHFLLASHYKKILTLVYQILTAEKLIEEHSQLKHRACIILKNLIPYTKSHELTKLLHPQNIFMELDLLRQITLQCQGFHEYERFEKTLYWCQQLNTENTAEQVARILILLQKEYEALDSSRQGYFFSLLKEYQELLSQYKLSFKAPKTKVYTKKTSQIAPQKRKTSPPKPKACWKSIQQKAVPHALTKQAIVLIISFLSQRIDQRGTLHLSSEEEKFFIETFIKDHHIKYQSHSISLGNILELLIYMDEIRVIPALCYYLEAIDPELLHLHSPQALVLAAEKKHLNLCNLLLERFHYNPNTSNSGGATPLYLLLTASLADIGCSKYAFFVTLNCLIDAGADINSANYQGITPLCMAVLHHNKEVIELLLRRGADAKILLHSDRNRLASILDTSATTKYPNQHPAIVALFKAYGATYFQGPLLAYSVDLSATSTLNCKYSPLYEKLHAESNQTILQKAFQVIDGELSEEQILAHFERFPYSLNHLSPRENDNFISFLSIIIALEKPEKIESLLEKLLNRFSIHLELLHTYIEELVDIECDRETLLFIAVRRNLTRIVELLLEFGANPNQANAKGLTALQVALRQNCTNINLINLLLQHSDLERQTTDGLTLLHIAVENYTPYVFQRVVNALREQGLLQKQCHTKVKKSYTPYYWALLKNNYFHGLALLSVDNNCQINAAVEQNTQKLLKHSPDFQRLFAYFLQQLKYPKHLRDDYFNGLTAMLHCNNKAFFDIIISTIDLNKTDPYFGNTLLHWACSLFLYDEIISLCSMDKIDINKPNHRQIRPLDVFLDAHGHQEPSQDTIKPLYSRALSLLLPPVVLGSQPEDSLTTNTSSPR